MILVLHVWLGSIGIRPWNARGIPIQGGVTMQRTDGVFRIFADVEFRKREVKAWTKFTDGFPRQVFGPVLVALCLPSPKFCTAPWLGRKRKDKKGREKRKLCFTMT